MSTAKRHEFAVGLDEYGVLFAEGQSPLAPAPEWTPEHLLLAALARCSMTSLVYHAKRADRTAAGRVTASAAVTRRATDGRFAFVETHVALDLVITPAPEVDALIALLKKAERDCFVGASLTAPPTYAWRINEEDVETVSPAELLAAQQPDL